MKLIAIINFFVTVLGFVSIILSGILLIRHRQVLYYFKDTFSFIKEDYSPEINVKYGNFFKESIQAIKFGFKSLRTSSSEDVYNLDKNNEINQIIVLLGKLLVFSGILGIVSAFISNLWVIFLSSFF